MSAASKLDPDEFAAVLMRCQRPLYTFLCRLVGQDAVAEDLVQEVGIDAWRARQREAAPFDGQHPEDEMRRWLFHVAYQHAISFLRRQRTQMHSAFDPAILVNAMDTPAFEDLIVERDALLRAMQTLDAEDVAVLLLFVVQGHTAAEVGDIIGKLGPAAAKHYARAKQRLRKAYLHQNPGH